MATVSYSNLKHKRINDGFTQALAETEDHFKAQGISILMSDGWSDVVTEDTLFTDYVDHLVEGFGADDEANFRQMAENTRLEILTESLSTNVSPVTSLSLPALRKTWPRLALNNAMPTEAIEKPKFTLMYRTPYYKGADGVEIDMISDFTQASALLAERRRVNDKYWTLPQSAGDLFSTSGASSAVATGLSGVGTTIGDSIDVDVYIESVVMHIDGEDVTIVPSVNIGGITGLPKLDTRNDTIFATLSATNSSNTVGTDTVFVQIDRKSALMMVSSVAGTSATNYVKSVKIKGFVSSEMNNRVDEIYFKLTQKEIVIPTADHLASAMPMEYLTDLLRMFNMDGVSIVVNEMSSFIAQKIDIEGLQFLSNQLTAGQYERTFDVHPYSHYTGSPTEWKSEIRTIVDNLCSDIFTHTRFDGGYFVLVANPIDAMLFSNIEWSFDNNMQEVAGVKVNYQSGFYTGAFKYQLVSSTNVTAGTITIFFVPTSAQDQMTYKFFPYSLSIAPTAQTGYRNPNSPNVPGIIASRRAIYEKMRDAIGKISILNNNGTFS